MYDLVTNHAQKNERNFNFILGKNVVRVLTNVDEEFQEKILTTSTEISICVQPQNGRGHEELLTKLEASPDTEECEK